MKRTLKFLSVTILALISLFAILAFAACDNGNGGGNENKGEDGYFVIYAQLEDGTKVDKIGDSQLKAQWCVHGDANGACSTPTPFSDGKAKISIKSLEKLGTQFDSHILGLPEGYEYDENSDAYVVSATGTTYVTITIKQK